MEIWLVVFLGPLIVIGAGALMVKAFQLVFSSDGALRVLSWRGFNAVMLVLLGAFGLVVIAGVIALWRVNPYFALLGLGFIAVAASSFWLTRHRHPGDDHWV
jgi:hypothetical protein